MDSLRLGTLAAGLASPGRGETSDQSPSLVPKIEDGGGGGGADGSGSGGGSRSPLPLPVPLQRSRRDYKRSWITYSRDPNDLNPLVGGYTVSVSISRPVTITKAVARQCQCTLTLVISTLDTWRDVILPAHNPLLCPCLCPCPCLRLRPRGWLGLRLRREMRLELCKIHTPRPVAVHL